MSNYLTPLEVCERLIGKPETVAEASGLHKKSAFPWRHASKWRDAGDLPSAKIMRALLTHSDDHALGLTARHLIWGAPEAEIAEILAARAEAPAPEFTTVRTEAA